MRLQSFAAVAIPQAIPATCLPTDSVGHAVYIRADMVAGRYQVETVDIDDPTKMPAIGVIVSKSTATECIVQLAGIMRGVLSGLTPNAILFATTSGTLGESVPAAPLSGQRLVQQIAQAISSTDIMIKILGPIGIIP